jgi:uncharacterized alpha-E superfamily protein
VLSRVAAAIYWVGRYIERAENTARFIDVNLQMSLDAPIAFSDQWEPLVAITGDQASFFARYPTPSQENVIQFLTFDPENPSSIVSCLAQARQNARSIREVISSEVWEQINRYHLQVKNDAGARRAERDSFGFFAEVKRQSHLVSGVADNTMSHGQAWHFLRLGRLIERSDATSRLIDVKYFLLLPTLEHVGGVVDETQWSIVLRSASAFEMYRKRYGRITPERVIEFLLLDTEFPRAVLFGLDQAEESLQAISGAGPGRFHNAAEQKLGRVRSELAYAQVYDIIAAGLHEFLGGLQAQLNAVGTAIAESFFGFNSPDDLQLEGVGGRLRDDVLPRDQSQGWAGGDRGYARDLGQ